MQIELADESRLWSFDLKVQRGGFNSIQAVRLHIATE